MVDAATRRAPLDTLSALLETACELSHEISNDASVGRILRALLTLPPDEREVIADLLDRATTFRRISEHTAEITGVRLRPNPHARLFVRVVEPAPEVALPAQDHDELVLGAIRMTKVAVLLERPEIRALWTGPALEAFRIVEQTERDAYVRLARIIIELIASIDSEPDRGKSET